MKFNLDIQYFACSVCSGGCGNSCQGTCEGTCQGTCEDTCLESCTSSCAVGCAVECSVGCGVGCTASCSATCADNCETDCAVGCAENCVSGCVLECAYSASGAGNRTIKLKRTAKELSDPFVVKEVISFGEPFYIDSKKYLMIGTNDNSDPQSLPVFKAFDQELIEKQVFYKLYDDSDTGIVNLLNQDRENIYPYTLSSAVSAGPSKMLDEKITEVDRDIEELKEFKRGLKYAGSDTAGGVANNSKRLNNTAAVGSQKRPVYFTSNGVPSPVDSDGLDISISGTAETANKLRINDDTTSKLFFIGAKGTGYQEVYRESNVYVENDVLFGAAWNDFAEYRCVEKGCKAGDVVCEVGDGTLAKSTQRLQAGASVVSDTYGIVIGSRTKGFSPLAVAGRVLVRTTEGEVYHPGDTVCAGEDGRVSVMSRKEIINYPDRILGYVSEIPSYEEWEGIKVKGRIWIKIH